jgi:hypothetical protein
MAGFTSISGHPERCMFMLRTADKATGVVAAMPRNPDGQPRSSVPSGPKRRLRFHHREHSLRQ